MTRDTLIKSICLRKEVLVVQGHTAVVEVGITAHTALVAVIQVVAVLAAAVDLEVDAEAVGGVAGVRPLMSTTVNL